MAELNLPPLNPAYRPGAESTEYEIAQNIINGGKIAATISASLVPIGAALIAVPVLAPAAPWVALAGAVMFGFSKAAPLVSQLIYTSSRTKVKLRTGANIDAELNEIRTNMEALGKVTKEIADELRTATEKAKRAVV